MGETTLKLDRYCPVCGANKPIERHETWCPNEPDRTAKDEFPYWVGNFGTTQEPLRPEAQVDDFDFTPGVEGYPDYPTTKGFAGIGEIRVTDPVTGGQKGSKLQRFSLIPSEFLWALAAHYGVGALKYEDRNWERGYAWSLALDAHGRHLGAFLGTSEAPPQRYDPETKSHHLIAAIWHLVALYIYDLRGKGTDDVRNLGTDDRFPR